MIHWSGGNLEFLENSPSVIFELYELDLDFIIEKYYSIVGITKAVLRFDTFVRGLSQA